MINFWKLSYKLVKEQRDQYKVENEQLKEENEKYRIRAENATELAERANCEVLRLERENRFLLSRRDNLFDSWRDENKRSVALSKKIEQLELQNGELKDKLKD